MVGRPGTASARSAQGLQAAWSAICWWTTSANVRYNQPGIAVLRLPGQTVSWPDIETTTRALTS